MFRGTLVDEAIRLIGNRRFEGRHPLHGLSAGMVGLAKATTLLEGMPTRDIDRALAELDRVRRATGAWGGCARCEVKLWLFASEIAKRRRPAEAAEFLRLAHETAHVCGLGGGELNARLDSVRACIDWVRQRNIVA